MAGDEVRELRAALEKCADQFHLLDRFARADRVKLAGKPYPKWKAVSEEAAAGREFCRSALSALQQDAETTQAGEGR